MKTKLMTAAACIAWQTWAFPAMAEPPATTSSAPSASEAPVEAQPANPDRQSDEDHDVLLRSNVTLGGYGGPDVRVTSFLAEPAMLVGANASWLADHRYFFGVGGYALATRHLAPETMRIDGNRSTLGLVYGGLRVGAVASPHRLWHMTIGALTGLGNLTGISTVSTPAEFEVGTERQLGHAESFFVVEPEVAIEMNAVTFMRIAAGASYRYVTGIEQPGLSSANLSGPAASLAFKFGVF